VLPVEPIVSVVAAGSEESAATDIFAWPAKVTLWPGTELASEIEVNEIAPVPERPERFVALVAVPVAEDKVSA